MKLFATCAFGLESYVEKELRKAGIWTESKSNGRVDFSGDHQALYLSNLILRTAERVYLDLGQFPAENFDQLFDGVFEIDWSAYLPKNARIVISPSSSKSQLYGLPTIQSISQKAIFKKLSAYYHQHYFEQDGEEYEIAVKIQNDQVSIGINTSGESLHKRGYRQNQLVAPIKETLAAGILQIAQAEKFTAILDPFCGSGTIGIEAALIDRQIAPGIQRDFAFNNWPDFQPELFQRLTQELEEKIIAPRQAIICSDLDPRAAHITRQNAGIAGLEHLKVTVKDFRTVTLPANTKTLLICNPPYGERLSEEPEATQILHDLGEFSRQNPELTLGILTPDENFAEHFGRPSDLNRKLYNGKIKCYFHLINPTV